MTTTFKKGTAVSAVLSGEIDVLLHCANCQALMGSGIAREIAERIPAAARLDASFSKAVGPEETLGMHSTSVSKSPERDGFLAVVNLYGQLYPGYPQPRAMNYGALAEAMVSARNAMKQSGNLKDAKIGIPYKMASDRAGGDWNIVLEMVQFVFRDYDITVYHIEDIDK
jgi:O-acetyl-ADP-ribose deacetylase (regulator of RNase III)